MRRDPVIRASGPSDLPTLETLYPAAFPDGDLLPLVRQLAGGRHDVISLVAEIEGAVAAHLALTVCGLEGHTKRVALLGPAAVAPDRQHQGIGEAMIRLGLDRMRRDGFAKLMVLGDPAYYGRFGFEPDEQVIPPYPLPEEWRTAWQSRALSPEGAAAAGQLIVPEQWRPRDLWLP